MNPFDIVIIVIVVFTLVRGIFRGLIKEISSIVGVLAGFYAAYTYYSELSKLLDRWLVNKLYLDIISFLVIFCTLFLVISILGVIIKYLLNIAFLGWVDRISGGVFGLLKGALIISIFVLAFTAFLPKESTLVKQSILSPHIMKISEKMINVVPAEMKQAFLSKFKELESVWKTR